MRLPHFLASSALAVGLALVASPHIARADVSDFTFNFDGNGNYSYYDNATPGTVTSGTATVVSDPSNPGGTALLFTLPVAVAEGDFNIFDPDGTSLSNGLRFMAVDGTSTTGLNDATEMAYYSNDGGQLANTGIPATFSAGGVSATQNPDGTFTLTNGHVTLNGTNVPEPASLLLLAGSLLGLGLIRRLRTGGPTAA